MLSASQEVPLTLWNSNVRYHSIGIPCEVHGAKTKKFVTIFTRTLVLSLSRSRLMHTTPPCPISLRYILILLFHLCLDLLGVFRRSGFPFEALYAFFLPPINLKIICTVTAWCIHPFPNSLQFILSLQQSCITARSSH